MQDVSTLISFSSRKREEVPGQPAARGVPSWGIDLTHGGGGTSAGLDYGARLRLSQISALAVGSARLGSAVLFLYTWVAGRRRGAGGGVQPNGRRGGIIPNPSQTSGWVVEAAPQRVKSLSPPSSIGSSCDIGRAPRAQGAEPYGDRDTEGKERKERKEKKEKKRKEKDRDRAANWTSSGSLEPETQASACLFVQSIQMDCSY